MSEYESFRPKPGPSDEAIIRDIAETKGLSFTEAREQWEIMKANANEYAHDKSEEKEK